MAGSISSALSLLSLKYLRLRLANCPICATTIMLKLRPEPIGVRCIRCGGSGIHMSLVQVLNDLIPNFGTLDVFELSSRGAFFKYLKDRCRKLVFSEYFDDLPPGEYRDGVQCQDVEHLTFADDSFDLCTSTEVFEHVPNDFAGFSEICRVLRPGGMFMFTVPLSDSADTVERANLRSGEIEYLLPPVYHGDRIRGMTAVLCFRDYGLDVVTRLTSCGFSKAELVKPDDAGRWGQGCQVVVARK